MPFPKLVSQSEIDQHLAGAKPRAMPLPSLPWGEALIGVVLLLAFYSLH